MRLSKSLVPTLREDPADAEAISHKLMLRAGLVRQLAAGIYVWLPLGQRVLDRINAIIREEMNAIGGQEMTMPVLHPAEIWRDSGRWDAIGPEMFRFKDRNDRDMCLAMTHEEVIAWLAAREIRSYRDLPQIWYQIQTKERDEARPRSGVLRTREFVMKDSYTLDPDVAALDRSYAAHEAAYRKIFDRCGLTYRVVQSDTGMMGGLGAHEFMAPSAAGEDEIAICGGCGYAANVELARGVPEPPAFPQWTREEVATPNARTIAEVAAYLKIDPRLTIKSLLFVAPKAGPVLVLLRGDHTLHERKLARALGEEARPGHPDEVLRQLHAPVGSVGPVGARVPVLADEALREGADADGIVWPASIAPFDVHVVLVSLRDPAQVAAAESIYAACRAAGLQAALDDRDERPGVKFKDADLLGVPVRVTVGNALAKDGVVEIKERRAPRREQRVAPGAVVDAIGALDIVPPRPR